MDHRDGTTHQWITPATDSQPDTLGFSKGFSFQNVPDMLAAARSQSGLKDGKATFYWTNEQSGRLMLYHDHAYGITRLNVYAGEAAGYLLVDPAQETPLGAAGVPGTIVTDPVSGSIVSADLAHLVPLVIQDKTFVPDDGVAGGQLAAQDPTWDVAAWGGPGSLCFRTCTCPTRTRPISKARARMDAGTSSVVLAAAESQHVRAGWPAVPVRERGDAGPAVGRSRR